MHSEKVDCCKCGLSAADLCMGKRAATVQDEKNEKRSDERQGKKIESLIPAVEERGRDDGKKIVSDDY